MQGPLSRARFRVVRRSRPVSRFIRSSLRTRWLKFKQFEPRCLLTTITITASADNTLYEESADESNGAGIYFFVGKTNGSQDPPASIRRALVKFDVAGSVPASAQINSVTLTLHVSRTIAGARDITVHRVLADWGEGASDAAANEGRGAAAAQNDATWQYTFYNAADPLSSPPWATPGGAFGAASATTSVAGVAFYTWSGNQMVADVQGWVNNPSSQFGWLLKQVDEGPAGTAKRFDSRQNGTAANRPSLTIDYTASAGATMAIAATSAVKPEGNAGSTAFTFTVTRSGDTSGASSVNYAVTGSGASPANAADFTGGTLPSGTVNFTATQTSQVVTINVGGDAAIEPDEGFTVTLSGATGGTLGTATALGAIQNADASLSIAATSAAKPEGNAGNTAFTFTVTRSGDTSGISSVNYSVTGSGASPADAADFAGGTLPSGTVNFAATQSSQVVTI